MRDARTHFVTERLDQLVRGDQVCVDATVVAAWEQGRLDDIDWSAVAASCQGVRMVDRVGAFVLVSFVEEAGLGIGRAGARVLRRRATGEVMRQLLSPAAAPAPYAAAHPVSQRPGRRQRCRTPPSG